MISASHPHDLEFGGYECSSAQRSVLVGMHGHGFTELGAETAFWKFGKRDAKGGREVISKLVGLLVFLCLPLAPALL